MREDCVSFRPEEEAELLRIAEADRSEMVSAEEVLAKLARRCANARTGVKRERRQVLQACTCALLQDPVNAMLVHWRFLMNWSLPRSQRDLP